MHLNTFGTLNSFPNEIDTVEAATCIVRAYVVIWLYVQPKLEPNQFNGKDSTLEPRQLFRKKILNINPTFTPHLISRHLLLNCGYYYANPLPKSLYVLNKLFRQKKNPFYFQTSALNSFSDYAHYYAKNNDNKNADTSTYVTFDLDV